MKSWFLGALMAAVAFAFVPSVADAKRLGGGASKGMQRSTPTQPAQNTPPSTAPAATNAGAAAPAAAGAAAAAGKRSWMGPIAGLAAGLGIAALFSHLGMGEGLANFVMIALLALAAFMAFRFFMSRRAGASAPRMATAAAGAGNGMGSRSAFETLQPAPAQAPQGTAQGTAQPAAFTGLAIGSGVAASQLPADFDRPAFERLAKMIFIRLQAANDTADVNDLRNFTTPELFADLRLDLQERGPSAQHTDVQEVNAEVLDFAQEPERQVVSVRFHGKIVETEGAEPESFDEIWHLVKPVDDSRNWAIAGIQQRQ